MDTAKEASQTEDSEHITKAQTKVSKLHSTDSHDPDLARLATILTTGDPRLEADREQSGPRIDNTILLNDPRLDPQSALFDFRVWASTFVRLVKEDGIRQQPVGFTFQNLSIYGTVAGFQTQNTVGSPFAALFRLRQIFNGRRQPQKTCILNNLNGSVKSGELLLVLGRPGSGCTTFLKSVCGQLQDLNKSKDSTICYDGIPQEIFLKEFKGEAIYNQENDEHFPNLTVGHILNFAAAARTPESRLNHIPRAVFSHHLAEVMMKIFSLSHTRNTKVGNDIVRGVSGGERKRVSIAEMALARSSVGAWDNSTRGLDAATALDFVQSLRTAADIAGVTQAVAIHQASQGIYNLFDKTMVLYEGRQIYFGPAVRARTYFEDMGWYCSPRQTAPDFLTSVTNPIERKPRDDCTDKLPRTAEDFERYWQNSEEYKACIQEISETKRQNSLLGQERLTTFRKFHHQAQAKHNRKKSPYILSIPMQIRLCMGRAYQRLLNDKASTMSIAVGRVVLALIVGSIYYGPSPTTSSLSSKGSVIFLAVLLNALMSVTEINGLYERRPIIEKHRNYAFYHPFADALAEILVDVPIKFVVTTIFNAIFYFLGGLRPEALNFFIFLSFNFFCTLLMSAMFRSIGACTKIISQAFGLAGVLILAMIIYTGFTLQTDYMHPWFRWINWVNPLAYVFEALLVNEVHDREFPCAPQSLVPSYGQGSNFACAVIGSVTGKAVVSGDDWVMSGYNYHYSHLWRNLGIVLAFMLAFYGLFLVAVEFNSAGTSRPQSLIFHRARAPRIPDRGSKDVESANTRLLNRGIIRPFSPQRAPTEYTESKLAQQATLTWQDVTLDIRIKGKERRLLDHVSGYVKSGTLTALMGVSGAGKTTLLDVLAQRHSVGILSGDVLLNGTDLTPSFQRKTGYVQQQDLHLESSTVREALQFSASLRQPASISQKEKNAYVETVIKMLDMEEFSEAVIGNPGEGLNLEQRKSLTIGMELAGKPSILFLDEPTSGLDSQSSWTIITFLRKLANNGQAVLSTIHQPSAVLFQEFDSLLLMSKGGRTAYFGRLGQDCQALTQYFENAGARSCYPEENTAEYILDAIGNHSDRDWHAVWKASEEYATLRSELDLIRSSTTAFITSDDKKKFAVGFLKQAHLVTFRIFQHYWRDPSFIFGKMILGTASALFIGFSFFLQNSSATGLQNMVFAIFMLNATFSTIVNQVSKLILAP